MNEKLQCPTKKNEHGSLEFYTYRWHFILTLVLLWGWIFFAIQSDLFSFESDFFSFLMAIIIISATIVCLIILSESRPALIITDKVLLPFAVVGHISAGFAIFWNDISLKYRHSLPQGCLLT